MEGFAGRLYEFAISERHGFREGPCHYTRYTGPFACPVSKTDRMNLNLSIRSINKHRFHILKVSCKPIGMMTIRPVDDDVIGMTLVEPGPLLPAEDHKIQRVECR